MYLYRRKSVKSLHNRLISHLECLIDRLALDKLRCHTAGCHCSTTAESLKLAVLYDLCIFINIQINTHDVTALCVTDRADTAGVLNLAYVSRIIKVIHYFFAIIH